MRFITKNNLSGGIICVGIGILFREIYSRSLWEWAWSERWEKQRYTEKAEFLCKINEGKCGVSQGQTSRVKANGSGQ